VLVFVAMVNQMQDGVHRLNLLGIHVECGAARSEVVQRVGESTILRVARQSKMPSLPWRERERERITKSKYTRYNAKPQDQSADQAKKQTNEQNTKSEARTK
jgi:hypothetical protein